MIIRRLTLHNFGVYAGTNTFNFKAEKPVVLIGGMNGRGKTTFLEAVLLALYSSNSFAYTEGKFKSYGQYLKSFVNKKDGTKITYVELEFDLSETETYIVHREWNGSLQRIKEEIWVELNGEKNPFLTENWSMFIENILPSGLSNFFFFDGEKIAQLAEEDTNEQMKESIRTLLGINIVDRLESDIRRIDRKAQKDNEQRYSIQKSSAMKEAKENAEAKLEELDLRIDELDQELVLINKQLEVEKTTYTTKGGDIVEKRQELFQERASLISQSHSISEKLQELAASALPLILTKDLLKKVEIEAKEERQSKENELVAKKI
jgi:DNA sulfur modification protein DndD